MHFLHKIASVGVAAVLTTTAFCGLTLAKEGIVNASVLNVRETPEPDATIIGRLTRNSEIDIIESQNGWHLIGFNGGNGFVSEANVTVLEPQAFYLEAPIYGRVNTAALNVRADGSYDAQIIGSMSEGTKVIIIGQKGDFFIVNDGDREVFLATAYVDGISEEEYYAKPQGAQAVVDEAMRYLGTPYVYGGSSPSGFDCSGFTSYVYRQLGVSLNRTAAGQASNGYAVSKSELQPGDLVMFNTMGSGIGHVGIYIGDGNMIHSPQPGRSVCIESIYSSYYGSRFVCARRIY